MFYHRDTKVDQRDILHGDGAGSIPPRSRQRLKPNLWSQTTSHKDWRLYSSVCGLQVIYCIIMTEQLTTRIHKHLTIKDFLNKRQFLIRSRNCKVKLIFPKLQTQHHNPHSTPYGHTLHDYALSNMFWTPCLMLKSLRGRSVSVNTAGPRQRAKTRARDTTAKPQYSNYISKPLHSQ